MLGTFGERLGMFLNILGAAYLRIQFDVLSCLCVWDYAIVVLWACEFVGVWASVLWVYVCGCVFVFICMLCDFT